MIPKSFFLTYGCRFLVLTSLLACTENIPEYVAIPYSELPEVIDYNIHVKPILSDNCYLCHGPDQSTRKAGLRFDTENGLYEKTQKGNYPVKPGSLSSSELINRILSDDVDYIMPPLNSHLSLSPKEKAILVKWVEQGGQWKKHWAFIPPQKAEIPELNNDWNPKNEIDQFIYAKLDKNQLEPNVIANKERLLRRVSIDLTGLPPSLTELNDFVNDNSSDAYEKVIDRLLNTDAHAERLTLDWLDLSRYSDSHGYHADGARYMWPWRDWVISAFRINMPYNQFVTEQLAGDLLPNAKKDQILATAFNRNHPITAEGGIIDEEFRVDYVANRTNTFGTAFLGLALECARCHDHKFDPVSQKEYFEMFAFFNNNRELGMTTQDGNFGPLMLLSTEVEDEKLSNLNVKIDSLERSLNTKKKDYLKDPDFNNPLHFSRINPIIHHPFENITEIGKFKSLDGIKTALARNKVSLVDGKYGLAARFNDSFDRIELTKLEPFENFDPFSVSIWINPSKKTAKGKTMTIIGNSADKNGLHRGWDLYLDSSGHLSARLISSLPNNYIQLMTKDSIYFDKWTHVLMTYDGSSKASGVNLYINGKKTKQVPTYDRLYKTIILDKKRDLMLGKSPRKFSGDDGVFEGKMDQLSIYNVEIPPLQAAIVFEQSGLGKRAGVWIPNDKLILKQSNELKQFYKKRLELIDPIMEMMVMEEMNPQRKTYILERGEYDKPTEEVQRGVPSSLLDFADYPKNRLGLSQWLFDKNNPLTARVAVNRYWQMIFGSGLVASANDFGNQGAAPSHPKLLDWLAVDFIESGWDVRQLIQKMVLSNTYKQSSKTSEKLREADLQNLLLARSHSYRIQAEFIRNIALVSSGLYNNEVGGKSVNPYQPEGLWIEKGDLSEVLKYYKQDHNAQQYRKSMYTFNKRTSPPPFMSIFDMPGRDVCTVSRERTNTPLQALSLLNDPQFVEASRALAFRMKMEGGDTLSKNIELGFELVLSRKPSKQELKILLELYHQELERYEKDKSSSKTFLSVGDYTIPNRYNSVELAAMTFVANTLFNMDEMYMRR